MKIGYDGDEEENIVDLTPGMDDKMFRLEKAEPLACRELNSLYR